MGILLVENDNQVESHGAETRQKLSRCRKVALSLTVRALWQSAMSRWLPGGLIVLSDIHHNGPCGSCSYQAGL